MIGCRAVRRKALAADATAVTAVAALAPARGASSGGWEVVTQLAARFEARKHGGVL